LNRSVLRAAPDRRHLLDGAWLRSRLAAIGVDGVEADLRLFGDDPDVAEVLGALELSAHVVGADPRQLTGQLAGRLMSSRSMSVQELLATLAASAEDGGEPWLRPATPSLVAPGGPLRRVLQVHDGWPAPVAFHGAGRQLLAAFQDGTLCAWDVVTGRQVATFGLTGDHEGCAASALAAAGPAGGGLVLCGYCDGLLRLWDPATGGLLRTFEGHGGWINAVALLGGGLALSASEDGTARLWDLTGGRQLRVFAGHGMRVTAVAPLAAGRFALSSGWDGGLRLWDLATGEELCRWELGGLLINHFAPLPGGQVLAAGEDGSVSLLDLAAESGAQSGSRRLLGTHDGSVSAVAVSATGERALSAAVDGRLKVWQLDPAEPSQLPPRWPRPPRAPRTIEAHTDSITCLAMSADGRHAASVSADRTLKLWDLEGDLALPRRGHSGAVTALAVSPAGRRVVSGSRDRSVRVWDLDRGAEVLRLAGHRRWVDLVALPADQCHVVTASAWTGELHVWDLVERRLVRDVCGPRGWMSPVAVTSDGRYALFITWGQQIAVWDLGAERPCERRLGAADAGSPITALAVTGDSRLILAGAEDGTVTVRDFASGEVLATHACHLGRVTALAATGDGRVVLSASEDGELTSWDAAGGRRLDACEAHASWIPSVAVSHDGRIGASVGHNQLRLWNLASGCEPLCTFTADSALYACALSADGRMVVAGEAAGRLHFLRLCGAF
jgi:WD40 repeat protein